MFDKTFFRTLNLIRRTESIIHQLTEGSEHAECAECAEYAEYAEYPLTRMCRICRICKICSICRNCILVKAVNAWVRSAFGNVYFVCFDQCLDDIIESVSLLFITICLQGAPHCTRVLYIVFLHRKKDLPKIS